MNHLKKDGFSILEVLIALAVFAIGIGSLLTALGYHLRDVSVLQDHGRAVRRSRLSVLREKQTCPMKRAARKMTFLGLRLRRSWTCRNSLKWKM